MMEVRNSGPDTQSLDRSQPIQKLDADGVGGQMGAAAGGGVVVDVGNAGAGAQVVKRKRGRPPKAQSNAPVAKKIKEEDGDEDVCFICFDGGSLVLCDRRGCPKAYHPACIKRDEAFFRSKAKWNCGWHICSICEKTAHHMCYTCTYSLCKGCIKQSDYVCVRGDKGFCTVCMKTITLIENSGQDGTARVDFDDKTSWEYLFKVYWNYTKGKLSLTYNELTQATNPSKNSTIISSIEPTPLLSGRRSITADLNSLQNLESNESKRRKTLEENGPTTESPLTIEKPKEWASKELLDFVSHMKNGDISILSQFDVQALLLEYIKRNNLRDPRKKTQIICDLRLKNLFGKPRVGHIEMLKLLEFHFLIKEDSEKNVNANAIEVVEKPCEIGNNNNTLVVVNKEVKERRNHRKSEKRIKLNKLDEYAAIDVHNMNLIYLRRNIMESLINEDSEKFHEKVVGSIVQIRISGSDQKDDMYRLVQVVGTAKVDVPYKVGEKSVDVMLEVINLDKKEAVSIDTISNQELSEDECRRLRESIRCGLVRCFTVGEIQEKAMALQPILLADRMEAEMLRLTQFRDRASEKRQKKGLRDCLKKIELLKTPEERERRLREIPQVHFDPKMNPDYESDDTEEYFNNEHDEHPKPKFSWASGKNTISPKKVVESLNDEPKDLNVVAHTNIEEDLSKATGSKTEKENENEKEKEKEKEATGLSNAGPLHNEIDCNGSTVSISNVEPEPEQTTSFVAMLESPGGNDDTWHYRDPSGNVQGPFSIVQLHRWNMSGYFPVDMRIWAGRESDSLLLTTVLENQFHKKVNPIQHVNVCSTISSSTVAVNSVNQIASVNVCSTISSTTDAVNSVNLETLPENHGSTEQIWNGGDYNLNCNPESVVSLTETEESTKPLDTNIIPSSTSKEHRVDVNQHVSSVYNVADPVIESLQSSLLKKEIHEEVKVQVEEAREKEAVVAPPTKLVVQETVNPPSWSTTLSLVVGGVSGAQLPETPEEWVRYPSTTTTVKPDEWDTGRVSVPIPVPVSIPEPVPVPALKPLEVLDHHVATTNTNIDQSSQAYNNMPAWHGLGLGETIEFSTLAEESVSDLLAEVDAMESRNGVPSPTSRRNSFLEDLFNGSIDDFSPTGDSGTTRSDGFSSTVDLQLHRHAATTTGLQQFSFGLESKPNSDNMGFKWADMGGSDLHPATRQDMIDLNDSSRAETDDDNHNTRFEEKTKNNNFMTRGRTGGGEKIRQVEPRGGKKSKGGGSGERMKPEATGTKLVGFFPDIEEEEGEFVQPEAPAPPPPPPPPVSPPPLPPPPPPPLTMGLDVVDSRRPVKPSQGTTSTPRVHAHTTTTTPRSGSIGRESQSHHRRSGDRYTSNSKSPRERTHHVEDSGYSRSSSRASWSRQSSFGGGSGGGGGYQRPPSKSQRVCKFYESGRCKKGSACNYLHPQER